MVRAKDEIKKVLWPRDITYSKFIIRTIGGVGDVGTLAESPCSCHVPWIPRRGAVETPTGITLGLYCTVLLY